MYYPFLRRYSRAKGRRVLDVEHPDDEPNQPQRSGYVEDGVPTDALTENSAEWQGEDGAELSPAEGDRREARSLQRRRPVAEQTVHRRKRHAFTET